MQAKGAATFNSSVQQIPGHCHGERVVGYDNQRGKGDHKHIRGAQRAYRFKDVPTLIRDFLRDVKENES